VFGIALWVAVARAGPEALLAPGPEELATADAELEARLVAAEAVGRAVARLQSVWITGAGPKGCADPEGAALTVRLRHFADAWHDTVQRVRVQADRVARLVAAPTLVPIVDAERRAQIDGRMARADVQEQAWLELVGWAARVRMPECAVALTTAPGVDRPTIAARGELSLPAAVTAIGGGLLCPLAIPADGAVAVVDGPVCWSPGERCDCTPDHVETGAVLGPQGS
jgi:hypothetical protein